MLPFFLLITLPFYSRAQDSVSTLETIQFSDVYKAIELTPLQGTKILQFDQQLTQLKNFQTLDAFLQQQSSVYIKSNGLNSNASLNIRGSSPAQNSVLWNGININNTALGATDLSTITIGMFEQVQLLLGSNTTILGSGSTGGSINLSNPLDFSNKREIQVNLFGNTMQNYGGQLHTAWSSNKWYLRSAVQWSNAQNQFSYYDQGIKTTLKNASARTSDVQLDIAKNTVSQANVTHTISFHGWLQNSDRAIPKALFETSSQKQQQDANIRLMAQYRITKQSTNWNLKLAYFNNQFQYEDRQIALFTQYQTHNIHTDVLWQYKNKSIWHHKWIDILSITAPLSWQQLVSNNKEHQLLRIAGTGSYTVKHIANKALVTVNIRQEWNNRHQAPFTPQLIGKYYILQKNDLNISAKGSLQKTYRLPTLNEWYYFPGGNTKLLPEEGWSYEATISSDYVPGNHLLQAEATLFQRNIKNWIYWLGGAIWTPHNIAQVKSQGLEWRLSSKIQWNETTYSKLTWNTTWSSSLTQASHIANDKSIGKQIPYSPRTIHQLGLWLQHQSWAWYTSWQYMGYRFTTNDESHFMPDYMLLQTHLQKAWKLPNASSLSTSIQIENLGNTSYQIVNGRPMPPTTITFSVSWKWQ